MQNLAYSEANTEFIVGSVASSICTFLGSLPADALSTLEMNKQTLRKSSTHPCRGVVVSTIVNAGNEQAKRTHPCGGVVVSCRVQLSTLEMKKQTLRKSSLHPGLVMA